MAELVDRIEGILHEPTQIRDDGRVDLSVAAIAEITTPGRVDFGGGELEPAATDPVPTAKRNPDDDYEWWDLNPGQYLITYNESLSGSDPVHLQTRAAVRERGAFHPSLVVEAFDPVPISVGGAGLKIKENARISTVAMTT